MEFTIRPPRPEDAESLWTLRRMSGVFENTMGLPTNRLSQTESFLSGLGPDDHQLVAAGPDGTVLGITGLQVCPGRRRHVGTLGIYVRTDCQGQGIGTALLRALLDIADRWLLLVRVELDVFADNEGAIRLYERLGFEREGVLRMAVIRDGKYADLLMMSRLRLPGGEG